MHRLRPAARRPGQLRRHSVPAVPRHFQGAQGQARPPTARDFAAALSEGVDAAYKAVMKPAEGTILTVSRLAAERAARGRAEDNADSSTCWRTPLSRAHDALDDTVNQNPVLKKAGVVDAGGKGFLRDPGGHARRACGASAIAARSARRRPSTKEKADFTDV